ncbi:hypothetical protein SDC9_62808 [bioreactor metagenome]|uniref:Uncharacterized protein n=1 Tax=bioreactor metagenome TaxID=1076179 RepID=A0A644XKZ7_9ZZZZ
MPARTEEVTHIIRIAYINWGRNQINGITRDRHDYDEEQFRDGSDERNLVGGQPAAEASGRRSGVGTCGRRVGLDSPSCGRDDRLESEG